jgi:hypothetical protein
MSVHEGGAIAPGGVRPQGRHGVVVPLVSACRVSPLKGEGFRADEEQRRSAARAEARPCLRPRHAMTTRIDEAPPRERTHRIRTRPRQEAQTPTRQERSDVASFSEAERGPKPLVAFEALPVPAPLPLTW